MNDVTLSFQVSKILEKAQTGASPEQRFIAASKVVAFLKDRYVNLDFHHCVSHLISHINYTFGQYAYASKKYNYKNSLDIVNFIFTHKIEKNSFAYSPDFLSNLKRVFNPEDLKELENTNKLNLNSKNVKNLYINKEYFNHYLLEINKINSSNQLNNIINNAIEFMDKNKVQNNYLEILINQHTDLLGIKLKSNRNMKISVQNLQTAFAKIYESETGINTKFILIDSFIEVFKITNIFEESFKPMNEPWPSIKKFLNVSNLKKSFDETKICNHIKNNKSLLEANFDKKLDKYQKIDIFGKPNLNNQEMKLYLEYQEKKDKKEIKRKKL